MKHVEIKAGGTNVDRLDPGAGREMRAANWIVSYPRSGNTFVRSLVANYFSEQDRPLMLDEIVESTRGEHHEPFWAQLTGKRSAERSFEEEWRARQPYFERLRGLTRRTMPLIKSHTVLAEINGVPAFQFIPGDRIINVVRHPCDVAVSASKFNNMDLDETINRLVAMNRCVIGHPNHGYEFIGSWSQHVRSWMQNPGVPMYRVRYVDLVNRTVETLMDIVRFLNFEPDPARAERAVDFAGFDRLRSEEQEKGFAEVSKTSVQPFFREGRPGQWLDALTVNQARKILESDPELINYFGFWTLAGGLDGGQQSSAG